MHRRLCPGVYRVSSSENTQRWHQSLGSEASRLLDAIGGNSQQDELALDCLGTSDTTRHCGELRVGVIRRYTVAWEGSCVYEATAVEECFYAPGVLDVKSRRVGWIRVWNRWTWRRKAK